MKLKYSLKKTKEELSQLIFLGKEIKNINRLSEENYKELYRNFNHWRKSIKDSFVLIFKDSEKMINEVFPSSGPVEMMGGRPWQYKFDHYMEEVDDVISDLDSIKKRLNYVRKESFIEKYFSNPNIVKKIFKTLFWLMGIILLFLIVANFTICFRKSKEINVCIIGLIKNWRIISSN